MTAYAVVTLTVEVEVGSSWGNECTLGQVHKQAKDSAIGFINQIAAKNQRRIKIVGELKVKTVINAEGER